MHFAGQRKRFSLEEISNILKQYPISPPFFSGGAQRYNYLDATLSIGQQKDVLRVDTAHHGFAPGFLCDAYVSASMLTRHGRGDIRNAGRFK
jgi:hypothetical protein